MKAIHQALVEQRATIVAKIEDCALHVLATRGDEGAALTSAVLSQAAEIARWAPYEAPDVAECEDDHAAWRQEIEDLKADVEMWKNVARIKSQAADDETRLRKQAEGDIERAHLCRFCELSHPSGTGCPPVTPAGTEWDQ